MRVRNRLHWSGEIVPHSFVGRRIFSLLNESAMADESEFSDFPELPSDGPESFEDMGFEGEDGRIYWWQSDLMGMLGYVNPTSFKKVVGKAMSAVTTLGLDTVESFRPVRRTFPDGREEADCQLSRFACYLTAINGDPNKPMVAAAQAYFTAMTEVARQAMLDVDKVERVIIRDEISGAENRLSRTAKGAGVQRYDYFRNEGYRGMYNMPLHLLKARKGVEANKVLFDFMGKQELAANLFRVTETDARVRKAGIRGQQRLEQTAFDVGRAVRETMRQTSGTVPEDLPIEEDIAKVRSGMKKTAKGFEKIDRKKLPGS